MIYVELRFQDGHRESYVTSTNLYEAYAAIHSVLRFAKTAEAAADLIYERLPHCRGSVLGAKHEIVVCLVTRYVTSEELG